jgi:DNA-binding transcriptional regulator GbsR (MarR family)
VTGGDGQRDEQAVARFVERFALDLFESGMPRTPARVFAALFASESGRLTAADLAGRLGLSAGAVSGAVRYLMQVRLVSREREPGDRRDHYRVDGDTWHDAILRREELLDRWERDVAQGIRAVGASTAAGRRLDESRRFFVFLAVEMPRLLARWQKVRDERRDRAGV